MNEGHRVFWSTFRLFTPCWLFDAPYTSPKPQLLDWNLQDTMQSFNKQIKNELAFHNWKQRRWMAAHQTFEEGPLNFRNDGTASNDHALHRHQFIYVCTPTKRDVSSLAVYPERPRARSIDNVSTTLNTEISLTGRIKFAHVHWCLKIKRPGLQ